MLPTTPPPANAPDPAASPVATGSPGRPRYRPKQATLWQCIPISLKLATPVLLVGAAWLARAAWREARAIVTFAAAESAVVPRSLQLTFYAEQFAFTSPSPPPALAQLEVDPAEELALGADLVPEARIVSWTGPGVGAGCARIVRGRVNEPIVLRPPGRITGRVGAPQGVLCFGVRPLGLRPVAGALVQALGGGEHGVLLGAATTGDDGRFELEGVASGTTGLGLRVLAAGYALEFAASVDGPGPHILPMVPTAPIAGAVSFPDGVSLAGLRVLAKGLPGVEAPIAADGTFALDHVPPNLEPRLLVHGLPPEFTHASVHASPGDGKVRIVVVRAARVRGRVVELQTLRPIAGAMVWHEHGPGGWISATTDESGGFELDRTPPGEIELRAQWSTEDPLGNKDTYTGERRLVVTEGLDLDNVIVRIE